MSLLKINELLPKEKQEMYRTFIKFPAVLVFILLSSYNQSIGMFQFMLAIAIGIDLFFNTFLSSRKKQRAKEFVFELFVLLIITLFVSFYLYPTFVPILSAAFQIKTAHFYLFRVFVSGTMIGGLWFLFTKSKNKWLLANS